MNVPVATCPCCGAPIQPSQIFVSLDTNSVVVGWSDTVVRLRPTETEVLSVIHKAMPRAVDRSRIIERVWGVTEGSWTHKNLDVQLSSLRRKLKCIDLSFQTLHGFGWRLVRKGA